MIPDKKLSLTELLSRAGELVADASLGGYTLWSVEVRTSEYASPEITVSVKEYADSRAFAAWWGLTTEFEFVSEGKRYAHMSGDYLDIRVVMNVMLEVSAS
jgi:hypothetical protein